MRRSFQFQWATVVKVHPGTFLFLSLFLLFGCRQSQGSDVVGYPSYFTERQSYEEFFMHQSSRPSSNNVRGFILPHHLAVGHDLADAYLSAKGTKPSVVVVIGPDHFRATKEDAVTSKIPHDTPYGRLETDSRIIDLLVQNGVKIDESLFSHEHSITSHTAFIKRQFPQANIIPIVVYPRLSREKSETLGMLLDRILPKDALVIASVDFVHNTPEYVSLFHDESARNQLSTLDIASSQRIDADCPTCLIAVGIFVRQRGAEKVTYAARTSIAEASHLPELKENASHVYMAFSDGNADVDSQDGVSMLFLGDFVLGSKVAEHLRPVKDWLGTLGEKDGKFFLGADIVGMNLEGPITDRPCTAQSKICLTQNPALLFDFFRNFPMFNLALFANNHARDAGEAGIDDTYSFLSSSKKLIAGARETCVQQKIRNQEIAICSFDDSNGSLDVGKAAQAVTEAKLKSAVVVASMHWGIEYTSFPTERQREVATALVHAGAKAIIGHGPHVIQPMEIIEESPVFYSLGNFLFEQPDVNRSSGLAVGLMTSKEKMKIFLYPIRSIAAQPSLLQGDDRLKALSQILPANEQDEAQNLMGILEVPL